MKIQDKIMKFRRGEISKGNSGDNLVYRVSKSEALEFSKFLVGFIEKGLMLSWCPDVAINLAEKGVFKYLYESLVNDVTTFYGVIIHPDWQEYAKTNYCY